MTARALSPITDADTLPVYPIDKGERLESHYYVEFHFNRYLASRFHLLADLDVEAVGVRLFLLAQNEAPVGTLPADERLLSKLVRLDLETWRKLCQRDITPLHNWSRCLCGSEVRLMHPVVTEMATKALASKLAAAERAVQRRDAKRLKDLAAMIERVGAKHVLKNSKVLDRLDEWLTDNHTGNRTEAAVKAALDVVCG